MASSDPLIGQTGDMRGVLFDIGGVFLVPDRGRIVQALGDPMEGLSDTAFDRAHFEGMHALDVTNASGDEEQRVYLDGYLTSLGIPGADREATIDAIRPLWSEPSPDLWQRILSGSISGLHSLGDANLSLGMVSNSDGHAEEALVRNGICQVGPGPGVSVLTIVDSFVVGVAKPDPAIFDFALPALALDPLEVIYVGDSVKYDVRSAGAAGMTPLHMDPFDLCREADHLHVAGVGDVLHHV